ncbi:MAG: flagellar hook-basal body complex protein FliE [Ferrimicrobium sp.]
MIPPIASITSSLASAAPSAVSASAAPSANGGFGQLLGQAVNSLQATQTNAAAQAQQVATGQANLGNAMVASNQELLATQFAVALRNGFVSALDQVMSTQF